MISKRSKPTASTGKTRNQGTEVRTCSGCSIHSVLSEHFILFKTCYTPPSNLPSQLLRFSNPNPFKIKPVRPSTVLVGRRLNGISCTHTRQPSSLSREQQDRRSFNRRVMEGKARPQSSPQPGQPCCHCSCRHLLAGQAGAGTAMQTLSLAG